MSGKKNTEVKKKVLDAALEMFREPKAFTGVRHKDIISRAGYEPSNVSRHLPFDVDNLELAKLVIGEWNERSRASVLEWEREDWYGPMAANPMAVLFAEYDYIYDKEYKKWFDVGDGSFRILDDVIHNHPAERNFFSQHYNFYQAWINEKLRAGGVENPEDVGERIYRNLYGVVMVGRSQNRPVSYWRKGLKEIRDNIFKLWVDNSDEPITEEMFWQYYEEEEDKADWAFDGVQWVRSNPRDHESDGDDEGGEK